MKHIFFIILLFIIASNSTNKAHAQFGLFDTVWTTNNFKISGSGHSTISNNDSLLFLFKPGKYAVLDDTSEKYVLIRTLDLNDTVWYISNFPTQNEPLSFIENDSKILFDSRTWTVPRTDYVNSSIITRNASTFQVVDSVAFDYWTFPPNTGSCFKFYCGVSEIDTSIYYWGYCGATAIKGISYKVNYKTGVTTITTDSLPYFAMTISEDGQYVAGVYYTGGTAINDPYNEVIEVRKISDYSVVFREESKYSDYDPNFYPYSWVSHYEFKFSKDNKYLALHMGGTRYNVFNLLTGNLIFESNNSSTFCDFSKDNKLVFIRNISYNNVEERYICIYNCEKNLYKELSFPDSNKVLSFNLENLLIDDKYLFVKYLDLLKFKKFDTSLGEIALLKINFDLTSVLEPENPIQGTLYPNPTNLNLNLKLKLQSPIALNSTLHNDEGRLIKDFGMKQCEEGENILYFDVSALPTGIYFLKITGKNFSQTYKVIINK